MSRLLYALKVKNGILNNVYLKDIVKKKGLVMLLLPGLLFIIVFNYLPMFGIVMAFKKIDYSKGIFGSDWSGFENFRFVFASPDILNVVRNTLSYNIVFIILGIIINVTLALILFEMSRKAVKVYQNILFIPFFLSWIVISYVAYTFLNFDMGLMNKLLTYVGKDPVNWYYNPKYWPFILVIANVWKNMGFNTIMYYTGLIGIDPSYYEATTIDGASKWQQVRYISIPLLAPVIVTLFLLAVGRIFNADFGLFYFLPNDSGMLFSVTEVMDTYVYRSLSVVRNFGMASAAGLIQSFVGFVTVVAVNQIIKKTNGNSIF